MAITDRYLKHPEAFPSPNQGEPWGEEELWIDFVGGPYRVSGLSGTQRGRLEAHFGEACIERPEEDRDTVSMSVRRAAPGLLRPPGPPSRELDFELSPLEDRVAITGDHLCATIRLENQVKGVLWTDTDGKWFTRNVFENFFRMLVTYRLLGAGGMLLHSAGVVSGGRAFLFAGRSGAGKSTLSRLSLAQQRTVLSDDMNAVSWADGTPCAERVPFTGDLERTWARGDSFPLAALLLIDKAPANQIRPLPAADALARLVATAPYVNADPYRMPLLLENLARLTAAVPAYTLEFSLSGDLWGTIESVFSAKFP